MKNTTKLALDSEIMFRILLAVSSNRDVKRQSILELENLSNLISNCEELQSLPQDKIGTAYIIYGETLLQALQSSSFTSFNDHAKIVLQRKLSLLAGQLHIYKLFP